MGVGAMDTRGASVDVIISGNYIGLSESTYQNCNNTLTTSMG